MPSVSRKHQFHPEKNRLVMVFLALLFVGLVFNCATTLFPAWKLPTEKEKIVTVRRGMNSHEIAELLYENQIIQNKDKFIWAAKLMGVSRKLQAGSYAFQGRVSNFEVLTKISEGSVITEQITFYEGISSIKIAEMIQDQVNIDQEDILFLVNSGKFARSLGIEADGLEGYLFPETYRFHSDASAAEIIERMVHEWQLRYCDSLRIRTRELGFTIHEIMTLASIVEGEAIQDDERPIIAAIYLNRLKLGRPLEACPTVQFLLPEGPRHLTKQDLEIDSPYNTYRHAGLPPGPVNNPGMKSILAVLYPADVDYLYLVANGDGTHTFSRNFSEHLQAKRRFDRIRRFYKP